MEVLNYAFRVERDDRGAKQQKGRQDYSEGSPQIISGVFQAFLCRLRAPELVCSLGERWGSPGGWGTEPELRAPPTPRLASWL